jgi:hypothetical protein
MRPWAKLSTQQNTIRSGRNRVSEDFIFKPWSKIFRLYGPAVITEKIDGTNAAVQIKKINISGPIEMRPTDVLDYDYATGKPGAVYRLAAQSRKRIITPGEDNYGFAAWVQNNALALARTLGEGIHFGEWFGLGINRAYGMDSRAFALFNTRKWADLYYDPKYLEDGALMSVPILKTTDNFSEDDLLEAVSLLEHQGSQVVEGLFSNPEGVVVYWPQADHMFKYTPFDGDGNKAREAQQKNHNLSVRALEKLEAAAKPRTQIKPEMLEQMNQLGRTLYGDHDPGAYSGL